MENNLINRQEAIDAICKACSMEGDYHKCDGYPATSTWCDELVALRAVPSAQQWIPVTERLPEEGNRYIIYHESFGIRIDTRVNGEWKTYGDDTVLAWMPLPEPYEGGE